MRRIATIVVAMALFIPAIAQKKKSWSEHTGTGDINPHKAVSRPSFPTEYKLFDLDLPSFRQELTSVTGKGATKRSAVVSLPNADGQIEDYELTESSNFEPALQERFPNIRAYSGRSLSDPSSTIKISVSQDEVEGMVFRGGKENEFIEAYSDDLKTYASFKSQRKAGELPWNCSTTDKQTLSSINGQLLTVNTSLTGRSGANLKTLRLAQSCNAEYANYFGATSAADVAKVLAAFNATLTRCNGVYEKDLALHLELIAASTNVIYYNATTDPYSTTLSSWNASLQSTLTSIIGEANYDIGHMFGATGGGGNAGCIGCVCATGKGSGITSPADGIPKGDNFDIDYVVHEVGHQLGANHTFSMSNEGTGVNKEVGSGITIMGYAGITSQDVAPHSIDIFHQASIGQIQANLDTKTCPVTYNTISNATPSVSIPSSTYTIPISTPFFLTGTGTDANPNDVLTYCWEQNDNATASQTNASSVANATKATGPNWISFKPSTSPTRIFPQLSTILAGATVTGPLTGGDAGANIEALSSVARTLNFRLTVRDNAPFSSVSPYSVGQTSFADVVVNVVKTTGAFAVTAPNTAVNWAAGSTQTITWSVNSTTAAPINCANVKISLSTDGGQTFPIVLAATTPNDGTETIAIPSNLTTTARVKIEAIGNIFFDISNTNFTIGTPPLCGDPTGLTTSAITPNTATLSWTAVPNAISYTVEYKTVAAATWTNAPITQTTTSVNLSGLTQGTAYTWKVLATCAAGAGNYITAANFTTTVPSCAGSYDNATNGTAAGAAVIPYATNINGLINVGTDVDFYKFTILKPGTISLSLTTLPANYNLDLMNSAGTTALKTSKLSGTTSESIANYNITTAGVYYARVYPNNTSTFNATTCYTLKVALGTATGKMSDVITGASNGIQAIESQGMAKAYPNPAKGNLLVSLDELKSNTEIILYNSNGVKVMSKRTMQMNNSFDISRLSSGMYLIKVLQNGKQVSQMKVIKQ